MRVRIDIYYEFFGLVKYILINKEVIYNDLILYIIKDIGK